ncbi:hypothetical protein Ssi02_26790 [Sinosporangium siamense]|uniref:Uncharacterized protein n=1 Tax=Sinosporangium siamense TaxID=1367973 RepID=A0A919V6F8_9ACTN|nr:hypothetical protein Ssi02_26790 [Sinosporangium siamense]
MPVRIERNPGAARSGVRSLTLEVSTDDGATWQPLPVKRRGATWTAQVTNPGSPGAVSLRGTAVDRAGNKVVQTVIRAYGIG